MHHRRIVLWRGLVQLPLRQLSMSIYRVFVTSRVSDIGRSYTYKVAQKALIFDCLGQSMQYVCLLSLSYFVILVVREVISRGMVFLTCSYPGVRTYNMIWSCTCHMAGPNRLPGNNGMEPSDINRSLFILHILSLERRGSLRFWYIFVFFFSNCLYMT